MELRFQINDSVIDGLKGRMGMPSAADATKDAIFLASWASQKAQAGCQIAAIDPSGGIQVFATPGIHNARGGRW